MNYKTQVETAIKKGLIKKDILEDVKMTNISQCLSKEESEVISKMSANLKKNQCLDNTYMVMKELNVPCCEGVAFIVPDRPGNQNNKGDWIKHVWNKKEDFYFDVTKEYVFTRNPPVPREIHYFLIRECNVDDYAKQKEKEGKSGFSSETERIENILKKINDENKDENN